MIHKAFADSMKRMVCPARLRAEVEALPAPRNRLHAPEAMAEADDRIAGALREAGWAVERRPFEVTNVLGCRDYADEVFVAGERPAIYRRLAGVNILALKEGLGSTDAVLVGAHHDTIRDSPGADDNTASVAALLELARALAPCTFERTVLLVAMDMEEIGFFGSRALVASLAAERRIEAALVYETMSYTSPAPGSQTLPAGIRLLHPFLAGRLRARELRGDWTLVIHRRSAAPLARAFAAGLAHVAGPGSVFLMRDPRELPVVGRLLARLFPVLANLGRSDHVSFWEAGIPAAMITDTADYRNPHYHQPTDTPETLDYERLAAIVTATAVAVAGLAGLREGPGPAR